jgi:hypothetical protein
MVYHILFIFAVFIVQSFIFPYISGLAAMPVLLPLASVGIAMNEGGVSGGIAGLFAGAMCDISFNQPIAVFAVVLTAIGLLVGLMFDTVAAKGFPAYVISCAVALVVVAFVQMFTLLFFEGVPAPLLITAAGQQTLISLIFTVPMYFLQRRSDKRNRDRYVRAEIKNSK